MEIIVNGQHLDIPTDFAIELEETNPFFSDKGSQSLPITLPFTPRNLKILDNPHRLARTNKLQSEVSAMIRAGVIQKDGRLVVFSASKTDGISATFYLKEGDLYTQIKDVHMNQLNFGGTRDPYSGNEAEKATAWMKHFEQVQRGEIATNYAVFPVCTKVNTDTIPITYELLNEPDSTSSARPYPLLGYTERTVDGVVCPVGYGVTPFLRFNYVLRTLFAHFGYALQESIFDTDPALSKIVLLNNNADSICGGKLNYQQLMPECNVTTFLETVRNKFCCEFIPDGNKKTVEIHFFETITAPDMDLTPYIAGEVKAAHDSFKQLRLVGGTAAQYADPAAETFEEFMRDNAYVSAVNEHQFGNIGNIVQTEVILRKATGQFYKRIANNAGFVKLEPIGSSFFNYDRNLKKYEYDERSSDDEQPAVVLDFRPWRLAPVVGDRRHLNTGIKKKENTDAEADRADECKIMFCFDIGMQESGVANGTPFCYNYTGAAWGNLSLQYTGENGLYWRFWRRYNSMLQRAFRKLTCSLRMPISEFLKFNIYTPKLLNGIPVLPVNMKYTIDRKGVTVKEVEFYTLRLLEPYSPENNDTIPDFSNPGYYWARRDNSLEAIGGDIYKFIDLSDVPAPAALDTYPPPTKEQSEGEKYFMETYSVPLYQTIMFRDPVYLGEVDYKRWLEAGVK